MLILIKFTLLISIIHGVFAEYSGPFILWGRNELTNLNIHALENIDDDFLRNIYSESTAIIIFMKNSTTTLTTENFPSFKEMLNDNVNKNQWNYLPQINLYSDPIDYNSNVEIINLVGPPSQQDIELSALYKDAVNTYGIGKVLGILANKIDHGIYKRDIAGGGGGGVVADEDLPGESSTTTTTSSPDYGDKPRVDTFIYKNENAKAIIYSSSAPILKQDKVVTILKSFSVTLNGEKGQSSLLIVLFKGDRSGESVKLTLRFRFVISNGYWTLNQVEVEEETVLTILTATKPPSAPLKFSHKCSKPLIFKNENASMTLTMENVQAQPKIETKQLRFGEAIDCVGFTTGPIWSGIFVSMILIFVLSIGIICIMDIKPPNRFESSRSKQLQFVVQE